MAVVMTQSHCMPEDARLPTVALKPDCPPNVTEEEEAAPLHTDAAGVFDISPETALELLCSNVEKLKALFEGSAADPEKTNSSTPVGSETPGEEGIPLHVTHSGDADHAAREEAIQLGILSRKFLSKKVPQILMKDYLLRLHRYCPMSTAVYLATSVYITKMALVEKVLRVTPKNMHRLVLAGLLVATKAQEDLGYPHSRFAKVGGVSERELSKLEISFCFLVDFELRVDAPMLLDEARLQGRSKRDSGDVGHDSELQP